MQWSTPWNQCFFQSIITTSTGVEVAEKMSNDDWEGEEEVIKGGEYLSVEKYLEAFWFLLSCRLLYFMEKTFPILHFKDTWTFE